MADRGTVLRAAALPVLGIAVALVLAGDVQPAGGWPGRFADAGDPASVVHGKQVYAASCASCHGRFLQGQPLWRMADPDRPRRAPALDETGPGWLHSDEELFAAVSEGHLPSAPPALNSRMPAFRSLMTDDEIRAVLAFVKARWPVPIRAAQAALNPGGTGRPRSVPDDWRFPPICMPRGMPANAARIGSAPVGQRQGR